MVKQVEKNMWEREVEVEQVSDERKNNEKIGQRK